MAHEASTRGHGGHPLRRLLPATPEHTQIGVASLQDPSEEGESSLRKRSAIRAACNACRTRKSKARDTFRPASIILLTVQCIYSAVLSGQDALLASLKRLIANMTPLIRTRRTLTLSNENTMS